MTNRARVIRLLAVALAAVIALTAAPAPAATPGEVRYGNKIIRLVNNIRDNNDRVELKKNKCLQRFANRQAERMANQRRLFHQDLGRIQRACGVGYVGENVARGNISANQMVGLWMNSSGHKANILFRQYRITGVAARRGGGQWWAAQVFGRKG
ncbi:MAG TPA: CAP domain-containing protein [Nocardioides sp.]|nr:CAP domain-containing protein [Nocardioides sp.]